MRELRRQIEVSVAGFHIVSMGLRHVSEEFARFEARIRGMGDKQPFGWSPDPEFIFGVGDPDLGTERISGGLRVSELRKLMRPGGEVESWAGRAWLVFLYARWDEGFRPRLARAAGLASKDDVSVSVFGDLRLMRHDIVHNGSVATDKYSGRCEALKWFPSGEHMAITAEHIHEFVDRVPWTYFRDLPLRAIPSIDD